MHTILHEAAPSMTKSKAVHGGRGSLLGHSLLQGWHPSVLMSSLCVGYMLTQWSLERKMVVIHDTNLHFQKLHLGILLKHTFWFSGSEWELRWYVCREFPGMSICPHGRVWTSLWGARPKRKQSRGACDWWQGEHGRLLKGEENESRFGCVGLRHSDSSCGKLLMTSGVRVWWESARGQREARIKDSDRPHLGDCMDAWWVGRKWSC